MWFGVLGPLEVARGDQRVRLAGPRQEKILAALLLDAGKVVSVERLVDVVWPEGAPETAGRQVRNVTNSLRRLLLDAGAPDTVIEAAGPGFVAGLAGCRLDLREFDLHVGRAEFAASMDRTADAVSELRAALALWRGPALSGLDAEALRAAATGLDERRLAALERRFSLELASDPDAVTVDELSELVARHPLREAFVGHLMTALYRKGRQAEAMAAFHGLHGRLNVELGVLPGQPLRALYERILRHDPSLRAGAGARPRPSNEELVDAYSDALAVTRPRGDALFDSRALFGLGRMHAKLGRYPEAKADLSQALTMTRAANDEYGVSLALGQLAIVCAQLGEQAVALNYAQEALTVAARVDVRRAPGDAELAAGTVHVVLGDQQRAASHFERAIATATSAGALDVQASALNALGRIHAARGEHGPARECFERARRIAHDIGSTSQQLRADTGLGRLD